MENLRIIFIGDSLIAGTGDPEYLGWAGRICRSARTRGHDVTGYKLGIRGNTTAQILARWREEAEARVAAGADCRLVFEFGINDTKDVNGQRLAEPDATVLTARRMLGAARSWLPALMIGPPPIADTVRNERVADIAARLGALCKELSVPYLDSFAAMRESAPWLGAVRAGDGVHPGAAGYDEWARIIEAWPEWRAWLP